MGDPRILRLYDSQPDKSPQDELKDTLSEIKKEREIKNKRKPRRKSDNAQDGSATKTTPHPVFNIESNNGNIIGSVGDNATFCSKTIKVVKSPPPDTIGAHGHMVTILNDKIKTLAEIRLRDLPKRGIKATTGSVFNAINIGFRNFMQRPHDTRMAITIAKEQNINRFDEILGYFNEKLSRTVTAKIKGTAKKPTSGTPFYELMKREKELLAKIGFKPDSTEVYTAIERYYGVSSHKDLQPFEHKDWISRIESIVGKVERGELHPHDIKF